MGKISRRANSEKLTRKEKQELRKENVKLQEQIKTVRNSHDFILKVQLIDILALSFFRSYFQRSL